MLTYLTVKLYIKWKLNPTDCNELFCVIANGVKTCRDNLKYIFKKQFYVFYLLFSEQYKKLNTVF